jgi:hypothetical protein
MVERIDAGRRKARRVRRGAGERPVRDGAPGRASGILDLQRGAGNRAVGQALGGALVQRKLKIGGAADPLEREADRAADAVVGAEAGATAAGDAAPRDQVQRKCSCQDDELLQGKDARSATGAASPAVESHVDAMRGGGQPLDQGLRRFFEPRFDRDLGGVKVHTGSAAAEAAQAVSARAFTVGRDIVFGAGEWTPETAPGRHLLAHELAHVVQQDPLVARRQPLPGTEELPGAGESMPATDELAPRDEAEELQQGSCAGGSRRLDYAGLSNFDVVEFTVPRNCRRVKVELNALWQCSGCEWGPTTYSVSVDGDSRSLPAGTQGIEEECTGTGAKKGRATFTVSPGVHRLRIATGRPEESSCRLQLNGFMEVRR